MRTHIWATVLRCGLLLPILITCQVSLAADAAEAPPDLAALVIRPSDLESIGLPDMTVHRSILADRARQAAEFTDDFYASYDSQPPIGTAIRRANPDLTYIQYLRTREQTVFVTLMSFSAHRDAERGMDAYLGTIEDWLGRDSNPLDLDGVDSAMTFQMDPGGPKEIIEVVVFQHDSMMAVVQTWSLATGEDVPVNDVAALQRDRLQADVPTGISDLVSRGLRLRIDGWNTFRSGYQGIEGEAIPDFLEINAPATFETRQEGMSAQGMSDVHQTIQIVYGDWDSWSVRGSSRPTAPLYITILGFDPQIGAWPLEEIRSANADFLEVAVPIDDYDSYGMFVSADESGGQEYYDVWVWLDENTVVKFRHVIPPALLGEGIDIAATNDLVLHQIACFEGTRSCDTPVRSPYTYGEED